MNYLWLAAVIAIESGGDPCVKHTNPKVHGATGMSEVALAELGYTPEDVHCNKAIAQIAAWKYQMNYRHLTGLDPYKMAQLHAVGPGNFVKKKWNAEYRKRFSKLYEGKK